MRELEVDIAVDRTGFTTGARPGIFALRAAPIQVNYLAYPGTMGADFIDYLIADETSFGRQQQAMLCRKSRLPARQLPGQRLRTAHCRAHADAQEVGLPDRGFVFCSFNNHYKITPPLFDVWMSLLRQSREKRVVAARRHRDDAAKPVAGSGGPGIDPQRLIFAPRIAPEDHLARHRLADLFLDTLPCNAHTTASDALWAGLPVLTCAGTTFAGRVAASLLRAIGLPGLITGSLDEYESLASAAGERAPGTEGDQAAARTQPRDRTAVRHRSFSAAHRGRLRRMWERNQRGETPASLCGDTRGVTRGHNGARGCRIIFTSTAPRPCPSARGRPIRQ